MTSSPDVPTPKSPKRFVLELPIEFRSQHDHQWWPGKTKNISANGVLFSAGRALRPLTPIEIKVQLPQVLTGDSTVSLLCLGHVVRTVDASEASEQVQAAATFFDYRLVEGKAGVSGELRQAQLLATRGNVTTLAQRLNTLLCIIMGNTELLMLEHGGLAEVRSFCTQSERAIQEAATILGSLVTMVRSACEAGPQLWEEWLLDQHSSRCS